MYTFLVFILFTFASCASNRPVATTHTERIEEKVMPIPVGADTIEIELCRDTRLECPNEQNEKLSTFNFQPSTCIAFLSKKPTSTASPQCRDTRLECPLTREGQNPTSTASPTVDCRPLTVNTQNIKTCLLGRDFAQQKQDHYVKEKSSYVFLSKKPTSTASPQSVRSVRNTNSEGVKSVQIRRATSCAARERIEEKKELKNQSDLCNLWETTHSEGVNSVLSVSSVRDKNNSVRNKNSVRISSTRGINISRHETDTSTRIRLTLRPDTVFVPYTNHIRSDTIVVPDRVCQQKLNRSNMTNLFLILILIVIIIFFLKNRMTR